MALNINDLVAGDVVSISITGAVVEVSGNLPSEVRLFYGITGSAGGESQQQIPATVFGLPGETLALPMTVVAAYGTLTSHIADPYPNGTIVYDSAVAPLGQRVYAKAGGNWFRFGNATTFTYGDMVQPLRVVRRP